LQKNNDQKIFMSSSITAAQMARENRGNEITRYSDEELEEFRHIVLNKLEEARSDFEMLRAALTGEGDNGTEDTCPTFRIGDDSFEGSSREEIAQLAHRRQNYMGQLRNALVRIENKTYGVCRVSGKLIPRERLRTVPHTTQCIDTKLNAA
jgi:DnaK suppressor protein